jgi:hypothetical protein
MIYPPDNIYPPVFEAEPEPEPEPEPDPVPAESGLTSKSASIFNVSASENTTSSYETYMNNAVERWNKVLNYTLPEGLNTPSIHFTLEDEGNNGTLGWAYIDTAQSTNDTSTFGYVFPMVGYMNINTYYYPAHGDPETTILHEMGHILGIGSLWIWDTDPSTRPISDDGLWYFGEHALREYKYYYEQSGGNPDDIYGIPIENDGGGGTAYGHSEEGDHRHISANNRYYNGVLHPGLGSELMTGWSDGGNELSRITIGFLEDLGYNVNYDEADEYTLIIPE